MKITLNTFEIISLIEFIVVKSKVKFIKKINFSLFVSSPNHAALIYSTGLSFSSASSEISANVASLKAYSGVKSLVR